MRTRRTRPSILSPVKEYAPLCGLLFVSASAPWLGSEPQTGWLTVGAFLVTAMALLSGAAWRLPRSSGPLVGIVAGVALFGVLQATGLPRSVVGLVSPEAVSFWREAGDLGRALGMAEPGPPSIALARRATLLASAELLGALALFVTTASLLTTNVRRRVLVVALLASCLAFFAVTAVRQNGGRLSGAFDPNNLAGFALAPLSLALTVLLLVLRRRSARPAATRREALAGILKRMPLLTAAVLLWLVLLGAVALTGSRAGLVAALVASSAALAMAQVHDRKHRIRGAGVAVALVVAAGAGALVVAGTGLSARLSSLDGLHGRLEIWRAAFEASLLFPVAGGGLGGVPEALARTYPFLDQFVVNAHSELLQALVAGGFVVALAVAIALAGTLVRLASMTLRQRHREESAYLLAGFTLVAGLFVHGFFECNLRIPATSTMLAVVLGLAFSSMRGGATLARERIESPG